MDNKASGERILCITANIGAVNNISSDGIDSTTNDNVFYFLKHSNRKFTVRKDLMELEFGVLTGEGLSGVASLLREIYAPVIDVQYGQSSQEKVSMVEYAPQNSGSIKCSVDDTRNEFKGIFTKFEAQIYT